MNMNLAIHPTGVHEEAGIEHGSAAEIDPPAAAPSANSHGIGVTTAALTQSMLGAPRRTHDPARAGRAKTVRLHVSAAAHTSHARRVASPASTCMLVLVRLTLRSAHGLPPSPQPTGMTARRAPSELWSIRGGSAPARLAASKSPCVPAARRCTPIGWSCTS